MTTKLKVTADEAKELVRQYDPRKDPRVWEHVCGVLRQGLRDQIELARGYAHDGRSIQELKLRLEKEVSDRLQQGEAAFQTAAEQFARNAEEAVYETIMDDRMEAIARGNREMEQARAEAARMNTERDRQQREARYQEDLKEAEARRNGTLPAKPCHL